MIIKGNASSFPTRNVTEENLQMCKVLLFINAIKSLIQHLEFSIKITSYCFDLNSLAFKYWFLSS